MQYRITAKYDPDFYRPIEAKLAIIEGLNGRLQYVSVNPRERIIKIITADKNLANEISERIRNLEGMIEPSEL